MATYSKSTVGIWISPPGFFENPRHHIVEVVICIRVVEAFGKAVDEDARVRSFNLDFWVGAVIVAHWQEDIPSRFVRVVGAKRTIGASASASASLLAFGVDKVVTYDRMDFDFPKETAFGFDNPKEENSDRNADCSVDTIFDASKDSHNHTSEEDDDL